MSHKEVYKTFALHFPNYAEKAEVWFPNGKNSVRIRIQHERDFIFTFNSESDWRFETVNSFINHTMKGGSKK